MCNVQSSMTAGLTAARDLFELVFQLNVVSTQPTHVRNFKEVTACDRGAKINGAALGKIFDFMYLV